MLQCRMNWTLCNADTLVPVASQRVYQYQLLNGSTSALFPHARTAAFLPSDACIIDMLPLLDLHGGTFSLRMDWDGHVSTPSLKSTAVCAESLLPCWKALMVAHKG